MEAIPGVFLLKERALWIPEISAIVIADVHLGYESGLFPEPFYPKMQIKDVSERMHTLMEKFSPERVIIDGDLKHEFSSTPYPEFSEVKEFLDVMKGAQITLIRGNHDNFIAGYLKKRDVDVKDSLKLGRFFFIHGHEYAHLPEGKITVMGHEHPVFRIRDEIGGSASFPCFLVSENLIVLPAFSEISGGADIVRGRFLSDMAEKHLKNPRIFAIYDGGIMEISGMEALQKF